MRFVKNKDYFMWKKNRQCHIAHFPNNGTIKWAHHFTKECAPVTEHGPFSWSAEVWLVHRVIWMALWINKETKQTTLALPTKLTSQGASQVDNRQGAYTHRGPRAAQFVLHRISVHFPIFSFSVFAYHLATRLLSTMGTFLWLKAQR